MPFIMNNDPYNLQRFIKAQDGIFESVLAELRNGQKRTHWMWFIFPQIDGLGHSTTSKYYSIKNKAEAQEYLDHPLLGSRLRTCVDLILAIDGKSAAAIFGFPDDIKLRSSMTLFTYVTGSGSVFARVLEKYFDGQRDQKTIDLLNNLPD
jgi:uncharacterized protein (DUF1810 family)